MTKEIKISNSIIINVKDVPDRHEDWMVVKETTYRPDRDGYILAKFNRDFPQSEQSTVQKVYALASRSSHINQWLAAANAQYAGAESVPQYLRDSVDLQVFKGATDKISEITARATKHSERLNDLASEYKEKVARENAVYKKFIEEKVGKDKIVKILLLNSTDMPVSLQLAIENWTPADDGPSQKEYAREMLVNYKTALIDYVNKNKECDIDSIIEEARSK